ncbi:MAG TPA: sugar phosphate isomerase/epimerase family protein [Verrucomicrobiae bacterium]|nr:sugar phosphate isomerase/epimerase family protein [Verrucomicrobiae bacterium]
MPTNFALNRRQFLSRAAQASLVLGGLASPLSAIEPLKRAGSSRLQLSLAAYSFRDSFTAGKLDLFQFLDFCADHGCDGAELTSYYFPKEFDTEFLLKVKRHAFLRGVAISGSAIGNTFTYGKSEKLDQEMALTRRWIDYAQILGAPHIRVFAGAVPKGMEREEAKRNSIAALEEACAYAGTKGVMLGLENHGGIVAEAADILDIIHAVKSPWFGINLDTANFNTDDPYADLAKIAPYAVNVQMKAEIHPRKQDQQPADLERLVKILRDANYQGYVALEYESKADPWTTIPGLLQKMKRLFAA